MAWLHPPLDILVLLAGPGISSYASTPGKAGESLSVCMKEAEQHVPVKRHQETPLYLGATAGMRLLKYSTHAHTQSHIYNQISSMPPEENITQNAFSCWHCCDRIPNSVIVFALAVEVLLSVSFFYLPICDLSPHGLYCQSSACVTVKSIVYDLVYLSFMGWRIDLTYGCEAV